VLEVLSTKDRHRRVSLVELTPQGRALISKTFGNVRGAESVIAHFRHVHEVEDDVHYPSFRQHRLSHYAGSSGNIRDPSKSSFRIPPFFG
jgi:hypothetical protein